MSRIAPGIKWQVAQGEVIGYVPERQSTGPHLHYEIMVNNRQVNQTVQLPAGKGVPNDQMTFLMRSRLLRNK